MKKLSLLILAITLIGLNAIGQNMYVRLGVGVAMSTGSSMAYSSDVTGSADMVYAKKIGYGTGLPLALGAGYFFSDNFGIELGVDYFYGFSSKYYSKGDNSEFNYKTKGAILSVVPALVVKFPLESITPYARLGLMVGLMNSVVTLVDGTTTYTPQKATTHTLAEKIKESGGVALGVQSALGVDFKLGEKLCLFTEIQLYGISYSPSKGEYKQYDVDGVDQLGNFTTKDKEWEYVKELDYTKNIPDGSPDEAIKVNYNFNNVGLNLGLKINL